MKYTSALAMAALAALACSVDAATLEVGSPVPDFQVSKWVKGTPVPKLEKGKVYVIEFWATWCGPCVGSIPHLTQVAHDFSGKATFIGVDVWEDDTNSVAKFVTKMGDKMDYNVAIDTTNTFMLKNWMEPADARVIPSAFIIDRELKIAWIGHPMGDLDKALGAVVDGKWDIALAKKRADGIKKLDAIYADAQKGADAESLEKRLQAIEVLDKELGGLFTERKFEKEKVLAQLKWNSAFYPFLNAVVDGEDAAKIDKLEVAAKAVALGKGEDFDKISHDVRVRWNENSNRRVFREYMNALQGGTNSDRIAEIAAKAARIETKDPVLLNSMAWSLLTAEKIKHRDIPLALKFAKAAVDCSQGKEPAFLDTYARALFDSGKVAEAVDYQKRAVAASSSDEDKAQLAGALAEYEKALNSGR